MTMMTTMPAVANDWMSEPMSCRSDWSGGVEGVWTSTATGGAAGGDCVEGLAVCGEVEVAGYSKSAFSRLNVRAAPLNTPSAKGMRSACDLDRRFASYCGAD